MALEPQLTDPSGKPLVSVVIPVYNGANYLHQAIDSALAQTWPNIEVIVVDDGSDDDGRTEAAALSYGDRIRYVKKSNGGVGTALNLGIKLMRSEYFSWLSHDDVYEPNKIDRLMKAVLSRPSPVVAFGDFHLMDEDGTLIREYRTGNLYDERKPLWAIFEGRLNGCAMIVPKRCFDVCGLFDPRLPGTQDYDLWFRMALRFPFVHAPGVAVFQRQHAGQGSKLARFRDEVELLWMSMLDRLPAEAILANASSKAAFLEQVCRYVPHLRGVCVSALNRVRPEKHGSTAAILVRGLDIAGALGRAVELRTIGFDQIICSSDDMRWHRVTVDHHDGSCTVINSASLPATGQACSNLGVLVSSVTEEFVWLTTGEDSQIPAAIPSQLCLLADDPSAVACLLTDFRQSFHSNELGLLEGGVFRTDALRAACEASTNTITSIVHALSRLGPFLTKIVPAPVSDTVADASSSESGRTTNSIALLQPPGPAPAASGGFGVRFWAQLSRWPLVSAAATATLAKLLPGNSHSGRRILEWQGMAEAFDADWYRDRYSDVSNNGIDPVLHYLIHGFREHRDPAPNFSTASYLADNPDIRRLNIHPLQHYVLWGHKEGRRVQAAVKLPRRLPDSATAGRPAILIVLHGASKDTLKFVNDLCEQLTRRVRPILLTITASGSAVLSSHGTPADDEPFPLLQALWSLTREAIRWDLKRIVVLHGGAPFEGSLRSLLERFQCAFDLIHLDYGLVCGNARLTDENGRFVGDAGLPDPIWNHVGSERRWVMEHAGKQFACSRSLANRLALFGVEQEISVAPPPDPMRIRSYFVWARPLDPGEPMRVALFGNLTREGGQDIVADVVRKAAQRKLPLKFQLYGECNPPLLSGLLETVPPESVAGAESLVDKVCTWHPHLAWYPSQAPDECGYTLNPAESMGLPIAASAIGASVERLSHRPLSWLLAWNSDPEQWIELFMQLRVRMEDATADNSIPAGLQDDHACYQRFYWDIATGKTPSAGTSAAQP